MARSESLARNAPQAEGGGEIPAQPRVLAHLRHVSRYWDREAQRHAAKLLPGEYFVSQAGELIITVLGSCVSACVRDPELGIGGMNHFMLPLDESQGTSAWSESASAATRYGNVAMERMVNDILKLGGRRERLEVKLVGGGRVLAAMSTDIGARNIEFVRKYVRDEGFQVAGEDLGDVYPRRVQYFADSGRIRVKKLTGVQPDSVVKRERQYLQTIESTNTSADVELF